MLEPLMVMISTQNHTKLKVSTIFLICDQLTIVHIILVPLNHCFRMLVEDLVLPFQNRSGYIYCISISSGIVELCPPDTEVSIRVGGCVNKTSR